MAPANTALHTWTIGRNPPGQVCEFLQQQADAGVNYFCFDYFDTLIVRDVFPEYTKELAASLHSRLLGHHLPPEQLYAIRQQLERTLCEKNAASGGEFEFYLDSFAQEYRLLLRKELADVAAPLTILQQTERFIQQILSIETAVEQAVQRPCPDTIQVLAWLRQQGFATVLISDFYLPGLYFDRMLKNMSLHDQFDHIYVSADHGLAKGSGRLYEKVCSELKCRLEQLYMIGDNPHSDIKMAQEKGLGCTHLRNPAQTSFYEQWHSSDMTSVSQVKKRFAAALPPTGVFKEISSSLWYFTFLLLQELQRQGIEHVFFFSKEGEFLKKLFDRMQDDLFGHRAIASHYFLVSRKATFLASLRPLAEEDFSRLFNHYRDISLRDFLLSLNIEESTAISLCEEIGCDLQTRHQDLQNRDEFKLLLQSDCFQQLYESRRISQRQHFITYLDSYNVDYKKNGLTIVDVGWKGSIQDNVFYILQGYVRMQGFYAGSLTATEQKENNTKKGLLFDDKPVPTPYFNVYNNNRSLFEMMLGASHGSADGYFTPSEFAELPPDHQREIKQRIATGAGELLITTVDLPEERTLFEREIKPVQEQIYRVARSLNRAWLRSNCTLPDPEWFARQHARMVFTPAVAEIDFFAGLYHLENFGIFEYTDFCANDTLSLKQRWHNFRAIRKEPAILEMGTWPPIILRRLGLDVYRYINGYRRHRREFKRRTLK